MTKDYYLARFLRARLLYLPLSDIGLGGAFVVRVFGNEYLAKLTGLLTVNFLVGFVSVVSVSERVLPSSRSCCSSAFCASLCDTKPFS